MKYDEDILDKLYLGIAPSRYYNINGEAYEISLLSTKDLLDIDSESTTKYKDDAKNKEVYMNMKIAYKSLKSISDELDFDLFCEKFDLSDIEKIVNVQHELFEKSPKIELIDTNDIDDLVEFFKNRHIQRYRWQLCQTFNTPPNILFGTGNALTDEQTLWVFIMETIDNKTKLEHWCSDCLDRLNDDNLCWNCGNPIVKQDEGTSETFDDDEWFRKAYGIWNEETQMFEIPPNSTFDNENKCWVRNNEYKEKEMEESTVLFTGEKDDSIDAYDESLDDDNCAITEEFEPSDWDDFEYNEEEDEDE